MAQGENPQDADRLGGAHKVAAPREPGLRTPVSGEAVAVVEGERAGFSRMVDDPDQVAKVVHTVDAPIEPPSDANARESTLRPARTPEAPFQDVQVSPDEPSVWTAAKDPS